MKSHEAQDECVCVRVCVCKMEYKMTGGVVWCWRGARWECGKRGRALWRFSVCSSSTTSSAVVVVVVVAATAVGSCFRFLPFSQ